MIPAVVTDPASGNPVVVASLERQRVKVEKDIQDACNEFLNEPDWNKNMGIVDSLNRSPYLCPFAIKEIRKQLKTKNPEIEILALQLTETIIKNCPASHAAVAQEDFMRYLVKVGLDQRQGGKWTQLKSKIGKKKNESKHVRSQCIEKALLMIKMLAIAYEESHLYPVFKATYKQLQRNKEVRFPETNKDESLGVFSPMHSSNAPDEFSGPTAMGSVQNVNLPMIRPVIIMENVKDPTLVQAQESAQVLFEMINAPVLSFELIPDLTQLLQQSQQQIVVMISEGNAPESVLMQALQINDKVNQVLEDAQAIANGTKRRYQEEVNVAKLMSQHSDSQNPSDAKDANDDDEPRLEESVSIDEADKDYSIKQPDQDKLTKKRPSKKSKRQSIDLLGMNSVDLMSAQERNPKPKKKEESEEDLMGFLGVQQDANNNNNGNVKPQPPKPTVFDPLEDDSNPPPPAYTGANYGNNNGNVFRQNNGNYNNNNGNYNNNNGNYNNNNNNNGNYNNNNGNYNNNNNNVNLFKPNNNNNNKTQTQGATQGASHRKLNTIARGNQSVLDVLTGEKSPSQSDPNSSNSSIKPSPQQNKQQPPKQEYNLGGPTPPKPAQQANNIQKTKNADDPFADMGDPFADMGGATFDDVMNSDQKSPAKPQQAQQQPKPKPQPKPVDDDPFSGMAGSAFDDPALSMISNEPKKQQPKPKPVPPRPAPPQHQDSNAIILGMLESGAPPDPNDQKQAQYNKPQQQQKQQQKKDDNPFAVDNPFGSDNNISNNNNNASDNPFDALDDPFGDDGLADNNQGNADPSNPFDALENPFADM